MTKIARSKEKIKEMRTVMHITLAKIICTMLGGKISVPLREQRSLRPSRGLHEESADILGSASFPSQRVGKLKAAPVKKRREKPAMLNARLARFDNTKKLATTKTKKRQEEEEARGDVTLMDKT